MGVFLTIFGVLFYFDNKDKFVDKQGNRRESGIVKRVLLKLASTLSIAEIEYDTVKPAVHFWLLMHSPSSSSSIVLSELGKSIRDLIIYAIIFICSQFSQLLNQIVYYLE